jgi:hypothetical protein
LKTSRSFSLALLDFSSASNSINEGMSEFDRTAKFFDDPYKPLMPVQPLIRAHAERLANEGKNSRTGLTGFTRFVLWPGDDESGDLRPSPRILMRLY